MKRRHLSRFLADDRAQATTEYILLLSVVISFFLIFWKGLLRPLFAKMRTRFSNYLDNLLVKGDLHRFPIH